MNGLRKRGERRSQLPPFSIFPSCVQTAINTMREGGGKFQRGLKGDSLLNPLLLYVVHYCYFPFSAFMGCFRSPMLQLSLLQTNTDAACFFLQVVDTEGIQLLECAAGDASFIHEIDTV